MQCVRPQKSVGGRQHRTYCSTATPYYASHAQLRKARIESPPIIEHKTTGCLRLRALEILFVVEKGDREGRGHRFLGPPP